MMLDLLLLLSLAPAFLAQAPPVDPVGPCQCSIYVETTRGIGDRYSGPLWALENESPEEYPCDDYVTSVCYLFCDQQMRNWLDEVESLDNETQVEVGPGIWETYKYGELFCQRSYQLFPGNINNYEGIQNEDLLLAVRIKAGDCHPWSVVGNYPERRLCCDESAQYIPIDECPYPPE